MSDYKTADAALRDAMSAMVDRYGVYATVDALNCACFARSEMATTNSARAKWRKVAQHVAKLWRTIQNISAQP